MNDSDAFGVTISFTDRETGERAAVITRTTSGLVGLCLTLERSGDLEVVMSKATTHELVAALEAALGSDRT